MADVARHGYWARVNRGYAPRRNGLWHYLAGESHYAVTALCGASTYSAQEFARQTSLAEPDRPDDRLCTKCKRMSEADDG